MHPEKRFADPNNTNEMVELQIDSSLDFWKPEEIMLITNFPYEYHGVKSYVLDSSFICDFSPGDCRIDIIIHLLENGILKGVTWSHDVDAFQMYPVLPNLEKDAGFTTYGWNDKWNTGSFFFKPSSLDIFRWIREKLFETRTNEEIALKMLTDSNYKNINTRYEIMNSTYNVGMRCTRTVVHNSEKPIRVAHFPAYNYGVFCKYKPILTSRLTKLISDKFNFDEKPISLS